MFLKYQITFNLLILTQLMRGKYTFTTKEPSSCKPLYCKEEENFGVFQNMSSSLDMNSDPRAQADMTNSRTDECNAPTEAQHFTINDDFHEDDFGTFQGSASTLTEDKLNMHSSDAYEVTHPKVQEKNYSDFGASYDRFEEINSLGGSQLDTDVLDVQVGMKQPMTNDNNIFVDEQPGIKDTSIKDGEFGNFGLKSDTDVSDAQVGVTQLTANDISTFADEQSVIKGASIKDDEFGDFNDGGSQLDTDVLDVQVGMKQPMTNDNNIFVDEQPGIKDTSIKDGEFGNFGLKSDTDVSDAQVGVTQLTENDISTFADEQNFDPIAEMGSPHIPTFMPRRYQ